MRLQDGRKKPAAQPTDLLIAPHWSAQRLKKFEHFQRWVLSDAPDRLPIHQLLVACLIAFDGPWTEGELLEALGRYYDWMNHGHQLAAAWRCDGLVRRRLMSSFTTICWWNLPAREYDWHTELTRLASACPLLSAHTSKPSAALQHLLMEGGGWTSMVLPPVLSAHFAGHLRLAAVPDSVWRRRTAINFSVPIRPPVAMHQERLTERMYEATLAGRDITSKWFLDALRAAVSAVARRTKGVSNGQGRQTLAKRMESLSDQLVHAGTPGILLFGWVQHLLAVGSARATRPAMNTIRNYFNVAAPVLLRRMNEQADVLNLESNDWLAMYQSAQSECSVSQRRVLTPALISFHRYLVEALDVDPIGGVIAGHDESAPAACVIWAHELETARRYLEQVQLEERLQSQCLAVLALLTHTSLRRSELFTLRLNSLWFCNEGMVVDVSPRRNQKSLKTRSARRRIVVRNAQAHATLLAWANRRQVEAAIGDDLLFGDPHRSGSLFRAGQTYAVLMEVLKRSTGDPAVTWHTCRHTYASQLLSDALLKRDVHAIRALHRLQRQMGHARLITTIETYCHTFEDAHRQLLDAAIGEIVTSSQLSTWTAEASDTLRQRKRRSGLRDEEFLNLALQRIHGHEECAPTQAVLANSSALRVEPIVDRFTVQVVINVLTDLQRHQSDAGICAANAISDHGLSKVLGAIDQVAASLDTKGSRSAVNEDSPLENINLSRMSWPRWQRAITLLDRMSRKQRSALTLSWRNHGSAIGLRVDDPENIQPILELLADAGYTSSHLRLRLVQDDRVAMSRDAADRQDAIKLAIAEEFGECVGVEYVKPRSQRHGGYLVPLTSETNRTPVPSACFDAKSLSALMFALSVRSRLEDSHE